MSVVLAKQPGAASLTSVKSVAMRAPSILREAATWNEEELVARVTTARVGLKSQRSDQVWRMPGGSSFDLALERQPVLEANLETEPKSCPFALLVPFALVAAAVSMPAFGADAAAANALARQNNCFKCHGLDKSKAGPSFKEVAAKFRGNKDAEAKLTKHLTTPGRVKDADGSEMDHPAIKAKNADDTKNLVDWILSL